VSTVASERWLLSEDKGESCLTCTRSDGPLVDCGLELEDGRKVYVCVECVTRLAKVARVGSKAVDAVREQLEAEIAERDQRLAALAGQLVQAESTLAEQREQAARRADALSNAKVLAVQAMGSLQQIGALE
jgi:hypothetical protein